MSAAMGPWCTATASSNVDFLDPLSRTNTVIPRAQHRTLREHRRNGRHIEGVASAAVALGRPNLNRFQKRQPCILAQLTHCDRSRSRESRSTVTYRASWQDQFCTP